MKTLAEFRAQPATQPMRASSRAKLLDVTFRHLGTPFEDNSAGDGPGSGIDERRMDNWATLDCVTYIEAVLAGYFDCDGALEAIRYNRLPATFLHRNHSTAHDWLPNAVARGLIVDATRRCFGPDQIRSRAMTRNPASWFRRTGLSRTFCETDPQRRLQELRRQASTLRPQRTVYDAVPIRALLPPRKGAEPQPGSGWSRLAAMPSGTLLAFFGRGEHLAWLINAGGEMKIRHANRSRQIVCDDELGRFFKWQVAIGYLTSMAVFDVADRRICFAHRATAGAVPKRNCEKNASSVGWCSHDGTTCGRRWEGAETETER